MKKPKRLKLDDLLVSYDDLETTESGLLVPHQDNPFGVYETAEDEIKAEVNLAKVFDTVFSSNMTVAPNLKIDDRDCEEFPNFYAFCMSSNGIDTRPFAKQLAIATHLLGEFCPRCSHKSFRNINNVPVDYPVEDFHKRVQFLHHGVCLKCQSTKTVLNRDYGLNLYKSLTGVAGQRCVTKDSVLYTSKGLFQFKCLSHKKPEGWSDYHQEVLTDNGIRTTSDFFVSKPEQVRIITLSNGMRIKGTKDHPLKVNSPTGESYVKMPFIDVGTEITWHSGQRVFGDKYFPPHTYELSLTTQECPAWMGETDEQTQREYLTKVFGGSTLQDGIIKVRIRNWMLFTNLLNNLGFVSSNIEVEEEDTDGLSEWGTIYIAGNYAKHLAKYCCPQFVEEIGNPEYNLIPRTLVTVVSNVKSENEYVTYDVCVPEGHNFICNGIVNHNSGKSALLGILTPYLLHKWLKMPSPAQTLGLMKNSILHGTVVGLTFGKAVELLYQPILSAILASPWFSTLFDILTYYGEKHGEELFKVKDTFMSFKYRGLMFAPSGPNKRTLRGNSRWLAVIDELGWFPHGEDSDERERASANEVYVALVNSLMTAQGAITEKMELGNYNLPQAYNMAISSPSSIRDKMMTMLRDNVDSDTMFCYHLPTWEMNPKFPRNHPDIKQKFKEDPVKAERDFGANPPKSENPWISESAYVQEACINKWKINYQYFKKTMRSGKISRFARVAGKRIPANLAGSILSIDAGVTNNSFAITIIRPFKVDSKELGKRIGAEYLAVAEVAPVKGEIVINHTLLFREFIYDLCDLYNVKLVVADRWQSLKALQDLEEDLGIPTQVYSLTGQDFTDYKDMIYEDQFRQIILPKTELSFDDIEHIDLENYPHCFKYKPASHLYFQHLTATLDQRGVAQKGNNLTDDLLRAGVLGVTFAVNEEVIDTYGLFEAPAHKQQAICVGTRNVKSVSSFAYGVRSQYGK